jgi:hypothetical protein
MIEEAVQFARTVTEPNTAVASLVAPFCDRAGHRVEQVTPDRAVAQFLGIQIRGIRGQPLDLIVGPIRNSCTGLALWALRRPHTTTSGRPMRRRKYRTAAITASGGRDYRLSLSRPAALLRLLPGDERRQPGRDRRRPGA